jgi:hypothetical protein
LAAADVGNGCDAAPDDLGDVHDAFSGVVTSSQFADLVCRELGVEQPILAWASPTGSTESPADCSSRDSEFSGDLHDGLSIAIQPLDGCL